MNQPDPSSSAEAFTVDDIAFLKALCISVESEPVLGLPSSANSIVPSLLVDPAKNRRVRIGSDLPWETEN